MTEVVRIQAKADRLLETAKQVRRKAPIAFLVSWFERYAQQARGLKVGKKYVRSQATQDLYDLARRISDATGGLDRLDARDWRNETPKLHKLIAVLRQKTAADWARVLPTAGKALDPIRHEGEAHDVANALSLLVYKVAVYAQAAKYKADPKGASWWGRRTG
jgi:hypothetical protein